MHGHMNVKIMECLYVSIVSTVQLSVRYNYNETAIRNS